MNRAALDGGLCEDRRPKCAEIRELGQDPEAHCSFMRPAARGSIAQNCEYVASQERGGAAFGQTPASWRLSTAKMLLGMRNGLIVASLMALLVGAFLIQNTM